MPPNIPPEDAAEVGAAEPLLANVLLPLRGPPPKPLPVIASPPNNFSEGGADNALTVGLEPAAVVVELPDEDPEEAELPKRPPVASPPNGLPTERLDAEDPPKGLAAEAPA